MLDLFVHNKCIFLGEDVLNVMSYLCSWRIAYAVKTLSAKVVWSGEATKVTPDSTAKVYSCIPSEVKANYN